MNRAWTLLSSMVLLPLLYSGNDKPSQLQKVQQRGSVTLLTRNSASSYYFDAHGPTGLEYELVRQFSHYLDVALKVETAETFEHLAEKHLKAGLTREEAAKTIGASVASVKTELHRARKKMAEVYDHHCALVDEQNECDGCLWAGRVQRRGGPRQAAAAQDSWAADGGRETLRWKNSLICFMALPSRCSRSISASCCSASCSAC